MPPPGPPTNSANRAPVHGDAVPLPLLDPSVLHELEDHLAEPLVRNFARDYIGLWEDRCRRLAEAVACPDGREAGLDAVISLKVTSAMIGCRRLAGLAAALEDRISEGALQEAEDLLGAIRDCGDETVEAIRLRYCLPA